MSLVSDLGHDKYTASPLHVGIGQNTVSVRVNGLAQASAAIAAIGRDARNAARESVKLSTRATLNALSGTIRISKKKRDIVAGEGKNKFGGTFPAWFAVAYNQRRQRRLIMITDNGEGKWPKNRTEASRSRVRNISNRGLAKKSVWWTGKRVKSSGAQNVKVPSKADQIAEQAASRSRRDWKGDNPYSFISDRLPYIGAAMHEGGDHAIDTLGHRAERWLEEYAKRELAKRKNT